MLITRYVLTFAFFLRIIICSSQQPSLSLYLIGDAGLSAVSKNGLKELVDANFNYAVPSAFIFLGDNIYPLGRPVKGEKGRNEAALILNAQIDLVKNFKSPVYFIPGNHDWMQGGRKGWERVQQQQNLVDSLDLNQFYFFPRGGCPGPVEIELSENLVLVVIDSQWFLHRWDKPEGAESSCDAKSKEEVMTRVHDILERNQHRQIVVAAHHPVFTYGPHGGVFTFKDHLFPLLSLNKKLYIPLPVVGSLYPLYRKTFPDIQDTGHRQNTRYRKMIMNELEPYPGIIYASGHEHALQYIIKDSVHYVVSGSGVKSSSVRKKGYADYVSSQHGFVRIDFFENGSSSIKYFEVNKSKDAFNALIPAASTKQR